jgi:DNA-binding transcriptional ArsR family regulator
VTDPKTMRALAHPLRIALMEELAHAGTLTATQASEILGESPANCSFHLRTLARYGFVEEAGGGQGRERPWRLVRVGMSWSDVHDDTDTVLAASALTEIFVNRLLDRIRQYMAVRQSYPDEWREVTGPSQHVAYVTLDEMRQLDEDVVTILRRYDDRLADPSLRPEDSRPVELMAFAIPSTRPAGK